MGRPAALIIFHQRFRSTILIVSGGRCRASPGMRSGLTAIVVVSVSIRVQAGEQQAADAFGVPPIPSGGVGPSRHPQDQTSSRCVADYADGFQFLAPKTHRSPDTRADSAARDHAAISILFRPRSNAYDLRTAVAEAFPICCHSSPKRASHTIDVMCAASGVQAPELRASSS